MGSKGGHISYGPLRDAIDRQTRTMDRLGQQAIDEAKREYDQMSPYYMALAEQQRKSSAEQSQRASELFKHWQDTTKPIEERLAREAQEFDSEDTRQQLASKASAEVARASANQRAQNERQMASMGVNPNSGRYQGLGQASALQEAAIRAGAMTKARQQARAEAQQRLMAAAALGRGLPGQSTAASSGSSQAAATGGALARVPGQDRAAARATGVGQIASGLQGAVSGLSGITQTQASQQQQSSASGWGSVLGGLGGLAKGVSSAWDTFSDIRLKTDLIYVGQEKGFNLYTFKYKGGEEKYLGVIADEVERTRPDAVFKIKGYKCVDYKKIGIKFKRVA